MGQKVKLSFGIGIWVIVWMQKPSHHFLQTFRPLGYACLRLCSAIVHFIRKIAFILSTKADQRKR